MSISYWLDNSNKNKLRYDFVIVGSGIAGLSAAYWLEQEHTQARIAIIDKFSLGYGASGRNAGFVTCGSALHFSKLQKQFGLDQAYKIWNFSEINRELLKTEIIQDQADDVDFLQTGSVTVASSETDKEAFQNILLQMKSVGIDVDYISADILRHQYAVKESCGAIEYKNDGVIHPIKLLQKIQSKLKRTDFHFGEEVFKVNAKVNYLQTQKTTYQYSQLFVCLNGYSANLLPELHSLIKPQRGQVIVTEPTRALIQGPCYLVKHLCYFRQMKTGEILIGGFRNLDVDNENTELDATTDKIQEALSTFVKNYFENTSDLKIKNSWSGIMGFTPDEQMIIGELPSHKDVYVMGGCSGHGMGLSFHAAKVMIQNSLGNPVPQNLSINRFYR